MHIFIFKTNGIMAKDGCNWEKGGTMWQERVWRLVNAL
jgi:hypothetical protein